MTFICFNGDFIEKNKPFLFSDNLAFKYGDGIFETILILNQKIVLEDYHFERLFNSLQFLQIKYSHLTRELFTNKIITLCKKNGFQTCRIRLTVFRDQNDNASYVIETSEVAEDVYEFNKSGWIADLYPYARKSIDAFSNLKSLSYQQFIMANKYAIENDLHETIILNASNHICEGSKTNIFIIKNQRVLTPALHEGCINGVMRKHVIEVIKKLGVPVKQAIVKEEDLFDAEEVFFTNALQVVKWVKSYKKKEFTSILSKEVSLNSINNF